MLHALLDEVVALQVGLRIRIVRGGAGGTEYAPHGVPQPQQPVLGGLQPGVAGGLDGERHDAVAEPFEVDARRR